MANNLSKVVSALRGQLAGPAGELAYRAKPNEEELFIAEIDLSKARDKSMTQRNNLLEDRRPEYYTDLRVVGITHPGMTKEVEPKASWFRQDELVK